ncbi:MAG: FKBP-type peptidyl-prolyl cis-trans isomerase [Ferruginibacter sp.]
MKKWFFLLSTGLALFMVACKKDKTAGCTATQTTVVATTAEIDSLHSYFINNGITNAIQHESGAFYTIDSVGTGLNPGICNSVAVTYSGNIFGNPVPFQSYTDSAGIVFSLGSVIVGWQRVLPELKVGGRITLYIPPSLGYGSVDKKNGDGDIIIPKNSYLKFNISLLEVY